MHLRTGVLALPVSIVLGLAMLAGSAGIASAGPQTKTAILTIHVLDRNGNSGQVAFGGYIGYGQNRVQGELAVGANKLSTGRYAIAVVVPTDDSQGDQVSNTLIARTVTLDHNRTLTLSARGGKPLQVSLNGVQLDDIQANVCASTGPASFGLYQVLDDAAEGPPQLYIVPYRSTALRFAYQATSVATDGTQYNLAGSFSGLPAKPVASFTTAGLAKVSLRVTAGAVRPWDTNTGMFLFSPGGRACGSTQSEVYPQSVRDPSATTEYFSPGTWLPTFLPIVDRGGADGDTLTQTYAAGHSYRATFYGAAWGPAINLPSTLPVAGTDVMAIQVPVANYISDPAGNVNDPSARAAVSLKAGRKTLVRRTLHSLSQSVVVHDVHHSGWYTATIIATRRQSGALLSPRVTTRWHFYASLFTPGRRIGVSYTQYRVGGLNLDNQAAPGARSTIGIYVVGQTGAPNNRRTFPTVRIQVSFNGGQSWRSVSVHRRGRDWTVSVRNPGYGNVSLRSTVINARGDSTVQTIYDAFGIS